MEVAGKEARVLSDDEVLTVLTREVKKRREAASAFGRRRPRGARRQGDRRGEVLTEYLPTQLGDDELTALVDRVLAEAGFSGPQAMGPAMKAVNAEVAGRADGKRVSTAVRSALQGG